MSTPQEPRNGQVKSEKVATPRLRRSITVLAHPGGRYPGVELPPTWFDGSENGCLIASELPSNGDHAEIVAAVRSMNVAIREAARTAHAAGEHPVLIGGDHSLAMGSIAAATASHERVAVIWVDAHADFNTMDSSPTGNPHGMPLAVSCGLGDARLTSIFERFVNPQDVILIAARDIDEAEQALLTAHGIWVVGVPELRKLGLPALVDAIARRFSGLAIHLSFDFDALSSEFFSATGTPVPGGLTPEEAEELLRCLATSPLDVVSSDWVEFDPRHEQAPEAALLARRLYRAFHETTPVDRLAANQRSAVT
jgi:arginase